MAAILTPAVSPRHLLLPEKAGAPAKADLRKAEMDDWRVHIGRAIERVRQRTGLSLKEFADAVDRDERQVKRWIDGTERPQLDALFGVQELRAPLVLALAELTSDIEVTTTITVRRRA